MTTKAITTEEEYDAALARLDELFELQRNKDEQAEFDLLATLIEDYEDENWPLEG
jgi:HTH-type transcriptional regulator/antitoxin HigA